MTHMFTTHRITTSALRGAFLVALSVTWLADTGAAHAQETGDTSEQAKDAWLASSQAPGAPGAQAPRSAPTDQPAARKERKVQKVCVWGRPLAQCKSSPILELGLGWAQAIDETALINGDFGWLFSRPGRHAAGATVGVMCNPDCNFSVKGRYRHYLANWVSLDFSPGFYVGNSRGLQLEAAIQLSDFIALAGGFTTTSSHDDFETGRLGYIGVRMGLPFMILALAIAGG